jgi:16S rRNA (guanine527-N7)-methyltransferase
LPLVRPGGAVVLWVGPSADVDHVDRVARQIGGEVEANQHGLVVLRKVRATPAGFPRRTGMAKKRPLL